MDPTIKRIFVDPAVPLPGTPLMRAAGVTGFLAFVGATLYLKNVEPSRLEREVALSYAQQQAAKQQQHAAKH
jgi:hypothetical protein